MVPVTLIGTTIIVVVLLGLLLKNLGKLKFLAVLSVVLVSGFAGTFSDTMYVQVLNSLLRWIAPVCLTLVAIYNIAMLPRATYSQNKYWGNISIPLFLFALFAALSTLYSPYPSVTLGRSLSFLMITLGTAVALIPVLRSRLEVEKVARAVAVLMGVLILVGVPLAFLPGSVGWLAGRYRSTWANPVGLSHISALLIPLYIWVVADQRLSRIWRGSAGVLIICLVLNIILSQSRSGVIGLGVALSIVGLSIPTSKKKLVLPMALFIVLGFVFAAGDADILQYFFTRGRDFNDPDIASGRAIIWQAAYSSWLQSPLIGHGFGTGGDPIINSNFLPTTGATRSFSLYLELLATVGTVGFLFMMWVFLAVLRSLTSGLYRVQGDTAKFIAMVMSVFACGIVLNLTETWIISAGSAFASYWWLMLFLGIQMLDLDHHLGETPRVRSGNNAHIILESY